MGRWCGPAIERGAGEGHLVRRGDVVFSHGTTAPSHVPLGHQGYKISIVGVPIIMFASFFRNQSVRTELYLDHMIISLENPHTAISTSAINYTKYFCYYTKNI